LKLKSKICNYCKSLAFSVKDIVLRSAS